MLFAGFYLGDALERAALDSLATRLVTGARLLHDEAETLLSGAASQPELYLWGSRMGTAADARVTLMRPDGVVIADSLVAPDNLAQVENHGRRPEVRAALAGKIGRATRRSTTVDLPLLYVAVPVQRDGVVKGVLRLALPMTEVSSSFAVIHRVLLAGGVVALAVAVGIGVFVAGRVTRPVV